MVLERLVASERTLRYHGDFDWPGVAIAGVLSRKVPLTRTWRFGFGD